MTDLRGTQLFVNKCETSGTTEFQTPSFLFPIYLHVSSVSSNILTSCAFDRRSRGKRLGQGSTRADGSSRPQKDAVHATLTLGRAGRKIRPSWRPLFCNSESEHGQSLILRFLQCTQCTRKSRTNPKVDKGRFRAWLRELEPNCLQRTDLHVAVSPTFSEK